MQGSTDTLSGALTEIDRLFECKEYVKVVASVYVAEAEHFDAIDDGQLSALEVIKGFSQLFLEKLEDAMLSFENALNLNPESSQACVGLGEVFYLRHQDENAKLMYGWAVKLDPENLGAQRGLEKVKAAIAAASVPAL